MSEGNVKALLDVVPEERHQAMLECLVSAEAQVLLQRYEAWLDEEIARWGLARVKVAVDRHGRVEIVDGASPAIERTTIAWEFLWFSDYARRFLGEEVAKDPLRRLYSAMDGEAHSGLGFIVALRSKRLLVAWTRVLGPFMSKPASGGVEPDWRVMARPELQDHLEAGVRRECCLLKGWDPVRRSRLALAAAGDPEKRRWNEIARPPHGHRDRRAYRELPITQMQEVAGELSRSAKRTDSLQARIKLLRSEELVLSDEEFWALPEITGSSYGPAVVGATTTSKAQQRIGRPDSPNC